MDDKLTQIFANYNPQLSKDEEFMKNLDSKLRAVELVNEQWEKKRKKNRIAIIAAAITGFVFGIISTISYPWLVAFFYKLNISGLAHHEFIVRYDDVIVCAILCTLGTLFTYTTYDIASSFATKRIARSDKNTRFKI